MKIASHDVEQSTIGSFDEIQSGIQQEDMGLALTMVSKNLYSNPIGSFIRELTCNGVDANVDAKVDKPVIVHFYKQDEISFVEFKDQGTGMSPDVFKKVYMNWFASDKRKDNSKIGGWGLTK